MATAVIPGYLFLVPHLQWPPQLEAIRSSLEAPLSHVLKDISFKIGKTTVGGSLDVALSVPDLSQYDNGSRSSLYHPIQLMVSGIYKLTCMIAARESINIEDSEGVDVRLILTYGQESNLDKQVRIGPAVTIQTLAQSGRNWQEIYSIDNEDGEGILRQFLINQDSRVKVRKIRANSFATPETDVLTDQENPHHGSVQHSSIAVGGTWDHIHVGHKLLLTMLAFLLHPERPGSDTQRVLTIGITGDELLKNKKHPELLESWHDRQKSVYTFLKAITDFRGSGSFHVETSEVSQRVPNGHAIRYRIDDRLMINAVEIADPFGPTITDQNITALVLSAETRAGGKAVNDRRKQQGWPELEVFEVDVLDANDFEATQSSGGNAFESKLSSTSIRKSILEKAKTRGKA